MTALMLADVVWPALFLALRMAAWWCVLASLLVEGLALCLTLPLAKALVISLVMNAASALCGTLLLPLLGIRLEAIAAATYNRLAWLGNIQPCYYFDNLDRRGPGHNGDRVFCALASICDAVEPAVGEGCSWSQCRDGCSRRTNRPSLSTARLGWPAPAGRRSGLADRSCRHRG